jgi:glutathione synthase/RimK-type ligase-like ATP-grasp enzyme
VDERTLGRKGDIRVALVSCADYPDLPTDDQLLGAALRRRGVGVTAAVWNDPQVGWQEYDAIVFRSCWDYHLHPAAFLRWLDHLEQPAVHPPPRVYNDVPTVRWNMTKTYLRDLEGAGVATAPTVWVPQGAATTLQEIVDSVGWDELVVKPTVSATAYETWRVERTRARQHEARFARLIGERDVMVQQFLPAVLSEGELSLVFLAGAFSHAVRKRPASGDFRVQEQFGGTAERADVEPGLIRQAAAAVAASPGKPLYARVDGVVVDGGLVLMELELVEPTLFFGLDGTAADRLAIAITRTVAAR